MVRNDLFDMSDYECTECGGDAYVGASNWKNNKPGESLTILGFTPEMISGLDVDKVKALFDMKREQDQRDAERDFNTALAGFQADCPSAPLDAKGVHDNPYSRYDTLWQTIRPHLKTHGLAVTFGDFAIKDGEGHIKGTIRHSGGHSETSGISLPVDKSLRANDTQKGGSAASYCKRYWLIGALNLTFAEQDDDGQAAGTPTITNEEADAMLEAFDAVDEKARKACLAFGGVESADQFPKRLFKTAMKKLQATIKAGEDS